MKNRESKIAKNFIYGGLGFPVIFRTVEVKEVMGEWVPNINHRKLQDEAFLSLLGAGFKFTGAHLSFVRHYMGLKQEELGQRLGLSGHSMVSKWEKKKAAATGMSSAVETGVRILMHEYLNKSQIPIKAVILVLAGDLEDPKGPVPIAA
jgi:DNA-binding transcriptional regulator YiaG